MTAEAEVIEREMRIAARPEVVFGFFTEPSKMMLWKGSDVALDPRPGGIYRATINQQAIVRGEYVEVVPHSRVVFTWGWDDPESVVQPGTSTVEVTLSPEGEGTKVVLVHRDLPAEMAGPHAHGWEHYLPRLQIAGAGGDAGPDRGPKGMD